MMNNNKKIDRIYVDLIRNTCRSKRGCEKFYGKFIIIFYEIVIIFMADFLLALYHIGEENYLY